MSYKEIIFCYLHHYRNVVIDKISVLNSEKIQILHMKISIYSCRISYDTITNLLYENSLWYE